MKNKKTPLALGLALSLMLAGCGQTGTQSNDVNTINPDTEIIPTPEVVEHQHSWSENWEKDEENHWHNCEAEGCDITDNDKKDSFEAHIFDDDMDAACNVCNHERVVEVVEPEPEVKEEETEPTEPVETALTGPSIYLDLYNTVMQNSLSKENYILTYSETVETNSLNVNDTFTSKYVDIYKTGSEYYFEMLNKGKAYTGEAEQNFGDGIKSFTARNASNVYTKAILKDFNLENGLNDIYGHMTKIVALNEDLLTSYETMDEYGYLTYDKLVDEGTGNTTYKISFPNINALQFNTNANGIVSYMDASKLNHIENSVANIEFVINSSNNLVSATITDFVDYGFFGSGLLKRHIEFTYEIPTVNKDLTLNTGILPATIDGKDYGIGRIITHKPYAAEQGGGTDTRKWSTSYTSLKDGSYREISLTAEKDSKFNVNGITSGMKLEDLTAKFTKVLYQNELSIIGLMENENSKYIVTCYMNDNAVKSIDIKILPEMGVFSKIMSGSDPWTTMLDKPVFVNPTDNKNVSEIFNIQPDTILSSLYKGLNMNKEIIMTLKMDGQGFKPYNDVILSKVITPYEEYTVSYKENDSIYKTESVQPRMVLTGLPALLSSARLTGNEFVATCSVSDITFVDLIEMVSTLEKYTDYAESNAGNITSADVKFVKDDTNLPVALKITFNGDKATAIFSIEFK